jgi:hypothetical protein
MSFNVSFHISLFLELFEADFALKRFFVLVNMKVDFESRCSFKFYVADMTLMGPNFKINIKKAKCT